MLIKAFFLSLQIFQAARLKSFKKKKIIINHSLNVSISHNIKQLFFYFTAVPQVSVMALKSKKVLNMCCYFCIVSMQFVFPFLVFFVLLFARTFNTEPLLVLGRGREDSNTGPAKKINTQIRCVNAKLFFLNAENMIQHGNKLAEALDLHTSPL